MGMMVYMLMGDSFHERFVWLWKGWWWIQGTNQIQTIKSNTLISYFGIRKRLPHPVAELNAEDISEIGIGRRHSQQFLKWRLKSEPLPSSKRFMYITPINQQHQRFRNHFRFRSISLVQHWLHFRLLSFLSNSARSTALDPQTPTWALR